MNQTNYIEPLSPLELSNNENYSQNISLNPEILENESIINNMDQNTPIVLLPNLLQILNNLIDDSEIHHNKIQNDNDNQDSEEIAGRKLNENYTEEQNKNIDEFNLLMKKLKKKRQRILKKMTMTKMTMTV